MPDTIYKAAEQTAADPFEFVLSTSEVDRHGDIVEQDWDLKHFRKNPIALWGHDSAMPIGLWKRVRVEGEKLLGRLELAEKGTSKFIDFLRSMVEQRILKAVSVGFIPHKHEALDKDDPWGGLRLSENELTEVSLVAVGANPDALSLAKSNLPVKDWLTVFSEGGENRRMTRNAAQQIGRKPPKSRDSDIHPSPSKIDSLRRTTPMTLSERIQAKQEAISKQRDASVEIQKQIDASEEDNISEELLVQLEETSTQIEKSQKELDVLLRAEKAMVLRAADTDAGDARKAALKDQEPTITRAPRIETRKPRKKGHNQMAIFACMVAGHVQRRHPAEVARASYQDEPELEQIIKAAVAPADTATPTWAGNLVQESYLEFLELLRDVSVYPQLPGTRTTFDRSGRIVVPQQQGRGTLAAGFIAEMAPIPVAAGVIGSTDLTPKKMAIISSYSKELGRQSTPNIQAVISDQILGDTAEGLDTHYLGAAARTAVQPAGLQDVTETGAGNINAATGATVAAINADSKAMIGRFLQSRSGANAVWIMNPLRELGLRTVQDAASGAFPFAASIAGGTFQGYPVLTSQNVPEDVVYLQSNGAMTYADAFMPALEVNDSAALVLSDDPATDFPATVNLTSLYQVDGVGVKMTVGMDWRITRGSGSIQVLTGVAW